MPQRSGGLKKRVEGHFLCIVFLFFPSFGHGHDEPIYISRLLVVLSLVYTPCESPGLSSASYQSHCGHLVGEYFTIVQDYFSNVVCCLRTTHRGFVLCLGTQIPNTISHHTMKTEKRTASPKNRILFYRIKFQGKANTVPFF